MEDENSGAGLCRRHMEAESQSFDQTVRTVELPNTDRCEPIHQMDDSQLVGAPVVVARYFVVGGEGTASAVDVEVKASERGGEKRKRGRPPRGQGKPPPPLKKKNEEEDVCFICFDGGSLVLCDRRGCPKAYHPACIKRDEAFFRSKARWNCGWHICSTCQKAAHYMCYTCTYSLCKGCTKNADYLCVRGDKGFCTTCMRTVMLIENNEQGSKEMAQIDFDDKSSWEYLFKVYWIYLKGKLSLTLTELTQAKNPWKGADTMACKEQPTGVHYGANDGKSSNSYSSPERLEANISKGRKITEQLKILSTDSLSIEKPGSDKGTSLIGCTEWATKELLAFVAHMKDGDISVLSQFDVQALLLDYIKRNNLRDPRRKSQIICDLRLKNLFGKPRVGHFEMLKLIEFHFIIMEDPQKDVFIQAGGVDAVESQVWAKGNNYNFLMIGNEKKRKTCRKGEERTSQINLDEYAAIDVHNINLIYMRRNLMESLIEDNEKFHDKVVGSIVRIRISTSDHKQDMYRLVQVVGTTKVTVPYKVGNMTTDVMLEVLNLDKKEAISIDAISNQEFSEDECRRLRQSIRCGLVKRLTVGKIQEKAISLQTVRLNDWLETEVLRLNHLRDRASEKGLKKELRECVEKLQLLKTPEERQRRLREIPAIHSDPKMDPNYESEEDAGELSDKKQGAYVKPRYYGSSRKGSNPISPLKRGEISNDTGIRALNNSIIGERSRNLCIPFYPDKKEIYTKSLERINEGRVACGSNRLERPGNKVDSTGSAIGGWNNQTVVRSSSSAEITPETSTTSLSMVKTSSANNGESNEIWHYQDPNGKIQGPFSMLQLQKWSTTGYFPPDMRIWESDGQDDSVLLTDALNWQFHKALPLKYNLSLQSQEGGGASYSELYNSDVMWGENITASQRDSKQTEGLLHHNNARVHSSGNNELLRSDGWGSQSSEWATPVVTYNKEIQAGICSQHLDSFKGNSSGYDQPAVHNPLSSSTLSARPYVAMSHQGSGNEVERWNFDPNNGNWNSHGATVSQITGGHSHENQSSNRDFSGQSSGQNWRPSPVNFSSNKLDSNSSLASVTKSTDLSEQNDEVDFPNLHNSTQKASNKDREDPVADKQQSESSSFSVKDSDILDLPSPTPKMSNEDQKGQATANKQSVPSNFPVQDSSPSWGSASSLVVGGAQLPEIADEWGGCSYTPPKPSVEEWDSSAVFVSSLNPPQTLIDHVATPTSKCDQLAHSPPSHPISNISSWQSLVIEPIEFSTFAEESVSDLLAQVDAMESQSGLASPTSVMKCGEDLIHGPKSDCFSSLEEFSSTLDPGKSDAMSSTGDIQLPCQSTMTDEPVGESQPDVFNPVKRSSGESSTSAEVDGETKSTDVPTKQGEVGSDIQPLAPFTMSQDMVGTDIAQRAGSEMVADWETKQLSSTRVQVEGETKSTDNSGALDGSYIQPPAPFTMRQDMVAHRAELEAMDTGWGIMQQSSTTAEVGGETKSSDVRINEEEAGSGIQPPASFTMSRDMADTNVAWGAGSEAMDGGGRSAQGVTNMCWGISRGISRGNVNTNCGTLAGSRGWESQRKHGGDCGPRDWSFQGGDSGLSRGKPSGSRQTVGSAGVGGYSRPLPKGQRVCKFYESGRCKKGAFCDYLHP